MGDNFDDLNLAADFLNHVYSVSIDPDRMSAFVESWEKQFAIKGQTGTEIGRVRPAGAVVDHEKVVDALDKVISAHATRIAELLSGFGTAALVLNRTGLIVASNDASTAVFGIMPGHRLSDLAVDAVDGALLDDQIDNLIFGREGGECIARFRQAGSRHSVLAHLRAVDIAASGRHIVMVTSEHSWPRQLTELLRNHYGVTERETMILQGLRRGETVADLAEASGRSEATIRSQIHSLLQKTELGSQSELVRLAATLLHSMSSESIEQPQKAAKRLAAYVLNSVPLPDGRTIHYRWVGAPTGRPFLLFPSGQGFIRWTDRAERDIERRNLAMIVPVRAGYGPSSPCPADRNIYDVAVDDSALLLKTLNVAQCPVVAICDDFKMALHFSSRHPELVTSIIGAAATMPLRTSQQFGRLTKFVRFIQMNATYAPRTLPYVSLLLFHMARRLGSRRFLETMMSSCAADVAALKDPRILAPLEASTEIVLSEHFMAHHSWSREIIEFAKPWADRLPASSVPIHLHSGVGDPFSPIETVREYCRLKPDIRLTEVRDAGQTLVYTHHDLVLDAVEAAYNR